MSAATIIPMPDGQPVEIPARLSTVAQIEDRHPGVKGRIRGFILRADLRDPDYDGLRDAVIRLGRSVYIDESRFLAWMRTHTGTPPARPRNVDGRAGKSRRAA